MSMYRQMWLAIILSTLLALLGGLLASTLNARSYLTEQLKAKNADNATALALALSQQRPDAVMVELAVSALFDSGHYASIRVVDPLGKTIVERNAPAAVRTVPAWFVRALPLNATPGQAQISNGWTQFGTVTLVSDSHFAYLALWKSVVQLVVALALSGLLGGFLGAMILRRLREPLQRVIKQASDISERRFVLIDVPEVPELKQLALAMNSTVSRLKTMFAEEAQRLEVLRISANYDHLTGLANRTFFLTQLLDSLDTEDATGGTLLLVRLAHLSRHHQRLGTPAVNDLLKTFAAVLERHAEQAHAVAARIGESDFALLLPGQTDAHDMARQLLAALVKASAPLTGSGPTAYIGMGKLQHGQDMAGLMAQVSGALVAAEATGDNAIREAGVETTSEDDHQTAALIRQAFANGKVRQLSFPVLDLQGHLVHRHCTMELMLDGTPAWQPTRHFRQIGETFQLMPLMDLSAIRLALGTLGSEPGLAGLAVSLSARSFSEKEFRSRLLDILMSNQEAARRLLLEVPEAAAVKHIDSFRDFVADIRKTGSRVGLGQFGRHFSEVDAMHDLGLDFLKVDASFVRGLQYSTDNQLFLKSLASAAHKMGMKVYADGVIDRAELVALEGAGFDGASGPAVKEPA
ncbi:MAG: LapD/MoxY N-terminal periplasmic domain-containing protein [Polaromonas sp.]|uniref:bifunctional diguanylate cyclase/phosphodiesterase n=1 Tax=Polaromonas sp. TaxID=1869339 RepID=UPI002489B39C|nr:LapD/MoxY N-terminal periplasmic domain-containing protein [Polaromonas sp.]MDI1235914.1 LapD/MoxY N-terminal periplasmic domain-containing protein [Polaromonas sp.]MDI1341021.1 LapD/MoxY N-terminal periplasmic domain-containing protein [Polaromonas sp.]